jgi:hypothetical protein
MVDSACMMDEDVTNVVFAQTIKKVGIKEEKMKKILAWMIMSLFMASAVLAIDTFSVRDSNTKTIDCNIYSNMNDGQGAITTYNGDIKVVYKIDQTQKYGNYILYSVDRKVVDYSVKPIKITTSSYSQWAWYDGGKYFMFDGIVIPVTNLRG